ncbi:MAG TPA: YwiC-like family protein [Trueperaceae bacterium]|nr:YwiC-like family protein [Trueperaceae bacterium]
MQSVQATRPRVRWRTLALPNEHGVWAFLLEPALLGLALRPSAAGVAFVVAALGALLAQHPLSLALADVRRGKRFPRTRPALALAAVYGAAAAAGLVCARLLGAPAAAFAPLALAVPVALVQLAFDARNRSREASAELAGAVALGALAAMTVLAGGGAWPLALGLWLVAAARNVPSILYIRARLRLQRAQPAGRAGPVVLHAVAVAAVAVLAAARVLPWLAVAAFALLALRAAWGLGPRARTLAARRVGMLELAYGVGTVAAVLAGLWLGW